MVVFSNGSMTYILATDIGEPCVLVFLMALGLIQLNIFLYSLI